MVFRSKRPVSPIFPQYIMSKRDLWKNETNLLYPPFKQQNAIMSESILGYERQKTVSNVQCWKENTDFLEVDKSIWESIKSFEDEEQCNNSPSPQTSIWDQSKSPLYYFALFSISNHNLEDLFTWSFQFMEVKRYF